MSNKHHNAPRLLIILALIALYFIWGSTFLAMKFAIESFPPLMMAAIRFCIAGVLLYSFLRLRGSPNPTSKEWLGATLVGFLLLSIGNAGVAIAEQTVSSGIAALLISTVPLLAAVFGTFWKHVPTNREWSGILVGTIGVAILNLGGTLQANPIGSAILLFAAACWALGSMWSKYLPMPQGAMASAAQMLTAGVILVIASLLAGETITQTPSAKSIYAMLYLVLFGSLIAYSAYVFLLKTVRPALATSYAFVNPVVAFILGMHLSNEHIDRVEYIALTIIIVGVLLVLPFTKK
ncbi:MAG: drug/metabolite exporter YedA [Methylophilaceae bacterium]|nr:drug/metabolite exporter YedA [Methylophilaceae bacterium]